MHKCTILMTTYQRDALLELGLQSLANQDLASKDVEILVLDDCANPDTSTRAIATQHGAQYLATSSGDPNWRIPGFALNIGVQRSDSEYIIISCAEMYHVDEETVSDLIGILDQDKDAIAITGGKNDVRGRYLAELTTTGKHDLSAYQDCADLKTHLPFFMGMHRNVFMSVRGYDEDFTGQAWDDNDLVDRLLLYGCEYTQAESRVVHLYHGRQSLGREEDHKERWARNLRLYTERKGVILRNIGKHWGTL